MLDDESFKKVLRSALNVSNLTTEQSCDRGQREGSLFLLKNCLSGVTFYRILFPTPISEFPEVAPYLMINDFPTAYTIVRAMFEAYANMFYLLIEPKSEEEKEHRLDLWECHGLSETLKMGKKMKIDDSLLKEPREKYIKLKSKITSSDYFKKLPESVHQSIRDSDKWNKEKDKVALAVKSGFHISQAEFVYKFLSNYTHSESYSLTQIGAVKSAEHSEKLLNGYAKTFTEMLLALTLNAFASIYPPAKGIIQNDVELLEIIDAWEKTKKQNFAQLNEEEGNTSSST